MIDYYERVIGSYVMLYQTPIVDFVYVRVPIPISMFLLDLFSFTFSTAFPLRLVVFYAFLSRLMFY